MGRIPYQERGCAAPVAGYPQLGSRDAQGPAVMARMAVTAAGSSRYVPQLTQRPSQGLLRGCMAMLWGQTVWTIRDAVVYGFQSG